MDMETKIHYEEMKEIVAKHLAEKLGKPISIRCLTEYSGNQFEDYHYWEVDFELLKEEQEND